EHANRFEPEETIETAMGEVLGADARVRFVPFAALLAPPDESPQALTAADEALAGARQAYQEMDLDRAKQLLQTGLKTYQRHLPTLAARPDWLVPMRDGFIELAKVRFFEGNETGARDALRYVFALDRSVRWNKSLFPVQMKKVVVEARLLFDTLGTG